jgi:hypothetical protein
VAASGRANAGSNINPAIRMPNRVELVTAPG